MCYKKTFTLPFVAFGAFLALSLGYILGGGLNYFCKGLSEDPNLYLNADYLTAKNPPPDLESYVSLSITSNYTSSSYSLSFPESFYAIFVSTNLVSQPCPCGTCRPELGIAVPEHIGVIGYDLRIEVSTNYLPIVYRLSPLSN